MIDAAKVYCPEVYAPGVAQAVRDQGLGAIEEGYFEEMQAAVVLIIPLLFSEGRISEFQVAQAAKEGTANSGGPKFDITAFACENLQEVEDAFESAGVLVWEGEFGEEFSGRVCIDTNY